MCRFMPQIEVEMNARKTQLCTLLDTRCSYRIVLAVHAIFFTLYCGSNTGIRNFQYCKVSGGGR